MTFEQKTPPVPSLEAHTNPGGAFSLSSHPHRISQIIELPLHALFPCNFPSPLHFFIYLFSFSTPSSTKFFPFCNTFAYLQFLTSCRCPVTMKKIVLKLSLMDDESNKRKALKLAAGVQGVDSVAVDMKEKKMTVIGDVDPVYLTSKLRKFGFTELLSVGPAKEEKKEGEKKEEKKPQGDAKKEIKAEAPKYEIVYVPSSYDSRAYQYTAVSEENPNACVIC